MDTEKPAGRKRSPEHWSVSTCARLIHLQVQLEVYPFIKKQLKMILHTHSIAVFGLGAAASFNTH